MQKIRFVSGLIILNLFIFGCSEKAPSNKSKITFKMPTSQSLQKAGVIQSFDANACFAINITGDNINATSAGSCDQSYGLFAGLAPAGGTVEIETQFGDNRTIDIYYVISESGCNSFDPKEGLAQVFGSNRVHRIGQKTGVDFDQPEVIVNMQIEWPDLANSFSALFNPPTSCEKADNPVNPMAVKSARVVQGAGRGVTANGSRVQVRILDQKLDMQSPSNWSGRILPNRLGDEQ